MQFIFNFNFTLIDYCHCAIFLISSLCMPVCSLRGFVSFSADDQDVMAGRALNGDWYLTDIGEKSISPFEAQFQY